jgi:hypothetical protein
VPGDAALAAAGAGQLELRLDILSNADTWLPVCPEIFRG